MAYISSSKGTGPLGNGKVESDQSFDECWQVDTEDNTEFSLAVCGNTTLSHPIIKETIILPSNTRSSAHSPEHEDPGQRARAYFSLPDPGKWHRVDHNSKSTSPEFERTGEVLLSETDYGRCQPRVARERSTSNLTSEDETYNTGEGNIVLETDSERTVISLYVVAPQFEHQRTSQQTTVEKLTYATVTCISGNLDRQNADNTELDDMKVNFFNKNFISNCDSELKITRDSKQPLKHTQNFEKGPGKNDSRQADQQQQQPEIPKKTEHISLESRLWENCGSKINKSSPKRISADSAISTIYESQHSYNLLPSTPEACPNFMKVSNMAHDNFHKKCVPQVQLTTKPNHLQNAKGIGGPKETISLTKPSNKKDTNDLNKKAHVSKEVIGMANSGIACKKASKIPRPVTSIKCTPEKNNNEIKSLYKQTKSRDWVCGVITEEQYRNINQSNLKQRVFNEQCEKRTNSKNKPLFPNKFISNKNVAYRSKNPILKEAIMEENSAKKPFKKNIKKEATVMPEKACKILKKNNDHAKITDDTNTTKTKLSSVIVIDKLATTNSRKKLNGGNKEIIINNINTAYIDKKIYNLKKKQPPKLDCGTNYTPPKCKSPLPDMPKANVKENRTLFRHNLQQKMKKVLKRKRHEIDKIIQYKYRNILKSVGRSQLKSKKNHPTSPFRTNPTKPSSGGSTLSRGSPLQRGPSGVILNEENFQTFVTAKGSPTRGVPSPANPPKGDLTKGSVDDCNQHDEIKQVQIFPDELPTVECEKKIALVQQSKDNALELKKNPTQTNEIKNVAGFISRIRLSGIGYNSMNNASLNSKLTNSNCKGLKIISEETSIDIKHGEQVKGLVKTTKKDINSTVTKGAKPQCITMQQKPITKSINRKKSIKPSETIKETKRVTNFKKANCQNSSQKSPITKHYANIERFLILSSQISTLQNIKTITVDSKLSNSSLPEFFAKPNHERRRYSESKLSPVLDKILRTSKLNLKPLTVILNFSKTWAESFRRKEATILFNHPKEIFVCKIIYNIMAQTTDPFPSFSLNTSLKVQEITQKIQTHMGRLIFNFIKRNALFNPLTKVRSIRLSVQTEEPVFSQTATIMTDSYENHIQTYVNKNFEIKGTESISSENLHEVTISCRSLTSNSYLDSRCSMKTTIGSLSFSMDRLVDGVDFRDDCLKCNDSNRNILISINIRPDAIMLQSHNTQISLPSFNHKSTQVLKSLTDHSNPMLMAKLSPKSETEYYTTKTSPVKLSPHCRNTPKLSRNQLISTDIIKPCIINRFRSPCKNTQCNINNAKECQKNARDLCLNTISINRYKNQGNIIIQSNHGNTENTPVNCMMNMNNNKVTTTRKPNKPLNIKGLSLPQWREQETSIATPFNENTRRLYRTELHLEKCYFRQQFIKLSEKIQESINNIEKSFDNEILDEGYSAPYHNNDELLFEDDLRLKGCDKIGSKYDDPVHEIVNIYQKPYRHNLFKSKSGNEIPLKPRSAVCSTLLRIGDCVQRKRSDFSNKRIRHIRRSCR